MNDKHETEELLVERALSRNATPADWDQLEHLAVSDPETWRRLALALRDECDLARVTSAAASVADDIELGEVLQTRKPRRTARRGINWMGWAAAAAIAAFWVMASVGDPDPSAQAGSMDEALERYRELGREQGRLVGELPLVMVDSNPTTGEQVEVVYMRRLVERRVVQDMVQPGLDELGDPVIVPVNHPEYTREDL